MLRRLTAAKEAVRNQNMPLRLLSPAHAWNMGSKTKHRLNTQLRYCAICNTTTLPPWGPAVKRKHHSRTVSARSLTL